MRKLLTVALSLGCAIVIGVACAGAPSSSSSGGSSAQAAPATPAATTAGATPTKAAIASPTSAATTPTPSSPQSAPTMAAAKPTAATNAPTATTAPTAAAKVAMGDPARGRTLFLQKGCVACHGDNAEGLVGPKIAGTQLSFEEVLKQVRNPRGTMQQFQPSDISDAEVRDVYVYLQTLR